MGATKHLRLKDLSDDRKTPAVIEAVEQIALIKSYANNRRAESKLIISQMMNPGAVRLLGKYGVRGALRRLTRAIMLDEYRPRDIGIYQFADASYLDCVRGEFSTFDAGLSRRIRHGALEEANSIAIASLHNCNEVAHQYADDLMRILDECPKLAARARIAGASGDLAAWEMLFHSVAKAMCARRGVGRMPQISVVDSWAPMQYAAEKTDYIFSSFAVHIRLVYGGYCVARIIVNRARIYNALARAGMAGAEDLFDHMLVAFMHEFGHFIDGEAPNKGAVGAQKMNINNLYKVNCIGDKEYDANPTEFSSDEITRTVQIALARYGTRVR